MLKNFQAEKLGEKINKEKNEGNLQDNHGENNHNFSLKKTKKTKPRPCSQTETSSILGWLSVNQLFNTCLLQVSVGFRTFLKSKRDTKMCTMGFLSSKLLRIKLSSTEFFFALDLISWEVL